jgi:hypothetical protein
LKPLNIRWGDDRENISCPSKLARSVVEEKQAGGTLLYIHESRGSIREHICDIELNVVGEIVIKTIRNPHNTRE